MEAFHFFPIFRAPFSWGLWTPALLGGRCRTLLPTLLAPFPGRGHKGFLTVWFPSLALFSIFFFFFPAFFPLGVERWLGVYFRRWEGDRFCNNKPAFLPAARDEWLWNLQTWLPTSAEKEAAWIEGKRFISFRLGGSANFPGAKRRGVKRTGLWSQAHGQTPFFLPFCLIFFPSLSFPPSPPPPTAAEYDLCKNSSGQSQAKPSAGSWYF